MMADHEIKLNICYGCMRKLEEGQKICPFCGYDFSASQNGADMLPEGTVLFRKYLIGRVLGRGDFGMGKKTSSGSCWTMRETGAY